MTISQRIFEELQKQGKKQKDLAAFIGISTSAVSDWKKKGTNPAAENISAIADFLNVSLEYLLTGEEKKTRNIGIQNSTVTSSNNIEVTGIKYETSTTKNELSETVAELVRVFENLPVKERVKLLNLVYDYEEKYQQKSI